MTVVINQMINFFILMGAGYALYKIGIMDADFNKKLTNFVLKFTMPCLIISSVFDVPEDRDYTKVFSVFLIAFIYYAALTVIGMAVAKIIRCRKENTGLYVFMTIFSNAGFMGFPITEAVLGTQAVFYTAIFNMMFNVFIFTIGVKAVNYPDSGLGSYSVKSIISHPGVLSAFIAVALYFINIKLPVPVETAVSSIGKVTSPVAMVLMGATLAKVPVKNVFNEVRIYIFVIIKQIILPLLAWFPIKYFIKDADILFVTLIMITMPIANTVVMFSIQYDRNEALATKNVFISTAASIFLFPMILALTVY